MKYLSKEIGHLIKIYLSILDRGSIIYLGVRVDCEAFLVRARMVCAFRTN